MSDANVIRVKSLQFIFVRPSRTDGVSGQDSNIQILEPCDMRIDFTEVGPTKPQNNSFHRFKRVLATCICRTKTFVTFFGLLITSKKQFTRIWPPEMWAIRIQCQPQIGLFTHRKTFFPEENITCRIIRWSARTFVWLFPTTANAYTSQWETTARRYRHAWPYGTRRFCYNRFCTEKEQRKESHLSS